MADVAEESNGRYDVARFLICLKEIRSESFHKKYSLEKIIKAVEKSPHNLELMKILFKREKGLTIDEIGRASDIILTENGEIEIGKPARDIKRFIKDQGSYITRAVELYHNTAVL